MSCAVQTSFATLTLKPLALKLHSMLPELAADVAVNDRECELSCLLPGRCWILRKVAELQASNGKTCCCMHGDELRLGDLLHSKVCADMRVHPPHDSVCMRMFHNAGAQRIAEACMLVVGKIQKQRLLLRETFVPRIS